AYHSELTNSSCQIASYTYLAYLPEVGSECGQNYVNATNDAYGNGWFDGYSIVGGHEFAETETDPRPGSASAWVGNGGETGDKCVWIKPGSPGGGYNVQTGSPAF